jgi:hypothetical protein
MAYPYSDSTSVDIKKVLFKPGIKTFNEDYQTIEDFREEEEIIRFNSIVKTPGIVAKKSEVTLRMFPTVVSGNQITISGGVGFTPNGARIVIPNLSINDITAIPGYSANMNDIILLVVSKVVEEYGLRPHPITGVQTTTRSRIKFDNTILQFIDVTNISRSSTILNDCVVIGRLSKITPIIFDTTELTGYRKILRLGEVPFVEITGATMEGDLDMNDIYQMLNLPQWGKNYYVGAGSVNNKDLARLFSRINCTLSVIKDLKFTLENNLFGIRFGSSQGTKISIIPNQQPPQKVDIILTNQFIPLPVDNVLYLQLTDNQVLLTSTGLPGGGTGNDSPTTSYIVNSDSFQRQNYFLTTNEGKNSGSSLLRFPIAFHFYDSVSDTRKLIFADGTVINYNNKIDEYGRSDQYFWSDGSNPLTGNLQIIASNAGIQLSEGNGARANEFEGINWTLSAPNTSTIVGRFVRARIRTAVVGDPSLVTGDYYLETYDELGLNSQRFIFRKDGRLTVPTAPIAENDAIRKAENDLKVSKAGDVMTGELQMTNNSTVNIIATEPNIVLTTTSANQGFQSILWKRQPTGMQAFEIAGITRVSDTSFPGYDEGDMIIDTFSNSAGDSARVAIRRASKTLETQNLNVLNDGTIGHNLNVLNDLGVVGDEYLTGDLIMSGKITVNSIDVMSQLRKLSRRSQMFY